MGLQLLAQGEERRKYKYNSRTNFVVEHQKCKQEASCEQSAFLSRQDGQLVSALFWLQLLSAVLRHALYPPPAHS